MATPTKRKSGTRKDYSKVAARVQRPAEMANLPRILAYGRNKKGKSTFGISAGVDETIVLDPERGTSEMRKKNPHVLPVARWEDMDDYWGYLRLGDHPYKWVCVDGLTKINNMALRYIGSQDEIKNLDRKPGMVDRRDYNKSGELMKQMLNNFSALPMGVVFTAQERMLSLDSGDSDEDDESTYFVPDLPAGVRGAVNSIVDVIGRIYTVRVEIKGETRTQRRLQIGPHERYDTGYRSDFNPPDMIKNPTIPKLISTLRGE